MVDYTKENGSGAVKPARSASHKALKLALEFA